MSEPFYLLVTGSRDCTRPMADLAYRVVERAKANGWRIIVGDASGVDTWVALACIELGVAARLCGITAAPRNKATLPYEQVHGDFLLRDEWMALCCNRCYAICRNHSRGTLYTYNHALSLGRPADIKHFN